MAVAEVWLCFACSGTASVITLGTSSRSALTVSRNGYGASNTLQGIITQIAPSHQPTKMNQTARQKVGPPGRAAR